MSISNQYESIWKGFIRPPRQLYKIYELGPELQKIDKKLVKRSNFTIKNKKNMILQCSHFETIDPLTKNPINQPCIIYLHCHSGSRLESLQYLEILISNGFSLFCFDFSGSGLSQGEYVTLGLNEVEDVGCVVQYLVIH